MGRYLNLAKKTITAPLPWPTEAPTAPEAPAGAVLLAPRYDGAGLPLAAIPEPVHHCEQRLVPQSPSTPAGIGAILRHVGGSCAPSQCPALPLGVRVVGYEPKSPPVAIDVCSIVTDVQKFIEAELRELDARLHSPVQIHGGWGVFTILDRLTRVGLKLAIEVPS